MEEKFKIFIDRLKNGSIENIEFNDVFSNEIGLIDEENLFEISDKITIFGKAYLADKDLIINLNINFKVKIPCKICNEPAEKEIDIKNLYITKQSSEIKAIYDFKEDIKNACFLEIPSFVECKDRCEKRQTINKYLKKENSQNLPFLNL
ncbi:MAG: hypothetical protein JXA94_04080 [Parachlamydiales bacterium]|nr:hypothetical protein [Parachlamydiales bacterium]